MSEFRIFFRPNWLPSLNPGLYDLTDRLMAESVPQIKQAVQRRETPNILVYGDFMLTFENYDRRLDDLFNLDKIQGTDLANLRAPLLHYGFMYVADREFGQANFRNAIGFVDPRSVRIDNVQGVIGVTVYSPAKLLEKGNAERVHRFSNISAPAPYLLLGYDLLHPGFRPQHFGTGTAIVTNASQIFTGNNSLFTQEMKPGTVFNIGLAFAVVASISSDGSGTFAAPWGGATVAFPGTAYQISGPDDRAFTLRNTTAVPLASTLPMLPGDKFVAVERVAPAAFVEAMDVNAISQNDLVVQSATPQGNDLLILTTVVEPDLPLLAGTATFQHLNPWWQYKRADELLTLLVAETNSALAAAGYPDALQIVQDIYSGLLGNSALDLIDDFNMLYPSTGITWAANGALRALLHGSGTTGLNKPDFLQDPAVTDRTFNICPISTLVSIGGVGLSGGNTKIFVSPDFGLPFAFPNPAPQFAGLIPPVDKAQIPAIGQEIHHVGQGTLQAVGSGDLGMGKWEVQWRVTPASYGAVATKYAYRLETYDTQGSVEIVAFPGFDAGAKQVRGFALSLYQTTDLGLTWALKPATTRNITRLDSDIYNETFIDIQGEFGIPTDPFAQGAFQMFPVAGGFLYVITDGGYQKPLWFLGPTETETPAAICAGVVQFQDGADWATNAGNRSGAVYDGTTVFYFEDQAASTVFGGNFNASMAAASTTIIGAVGSAFLSKLKPGDKIFFAYGGQPAPNLFTVLTVNSDTNITTVETNTGANIPSQFYRIIKPLRDPRLWYWDGAQMMRAALVGFPDLSKADFAHAFIDKSRNRLYIVNGGVLYRITLSWNLAAQTLTAVQVFTTVIDQPSYNANNDSLPVLPGGINNVILRVGPMAWLTGPIDIPMGASGRTVPYPTGTDSILVGTVTEDYVFSDRFGGVIKIADFEGLTASTAMAKLAQIPHQIMTSGPDQAMTTSPETYHPKPTVFVQSRVPTGDPTFDLTEFAMTATDEPWIVQYGSVSVENPKFLNDAGDQKYPPVSNDRLFFFNGVLYAVASLRYAGVTNLPLENPFVFTRSMMKLIANLAAYEFLIPRNSAHIKILDPFSVYNTTPLKVLDIVTYLVRGIDHYAGPKYATGRVLSVNYSLRDDIIDLEIA